MENEQKISDPRGYIRINILTFVYINRTRIAFILTDIIK